jgi:hypothetical protein
VRFDLRLLDSESNVVFNNEGYVLGNRFIGKVIGAEPVLSRWRAREGEPAGQNLFSTDDRIQ